MDEIDINQIVEYMNLAEKQKGMTGEQKQEFVMNLMQDVIPEDVFEQYEQLIILLITMLCKITKQDIKIAINKTKKCFLKICK